MSSPGQQTILITGATSGLGRQTAEALAGRGATVLLNGRDRRRGEAALEEIRGATGNERLHLHVADLSSLPEVTRLADEVMEAHDRLDVLVNNAGIGAGRGGRKTSQDGHELRFAVNYLAGYALTRRLLALLRRSAPARIVNVSSVGQAPIDPGDVMLERGYDGFRAYAQSKLAQILFTLELDERLRAAGEHDVTVNALHPATLMDTGMVREFGRPRTTVAEGVEALLPLVVADELEGVSGRYFDRLEESAAHRQAYDAEARVRLWQLSARLTGLPEDL